MVQLNLSFWTFWRNIPGDILLKSFESNDQSIYINTNLVQKRTQKEKDGEAIIEINISWWIKLVGKTALCWVLCSVDLMHYYTDFVPPWWHFYIKKVHISLLVSKAKYHLFSGCRKLRFPILCIVLEQSTF